MTPLVLAPVAAETVTSHFTQKEMQSFVDELYKTLPEVHEIYKEYLVSVVEQPDLDEIFIEIYKRARDFFLKNPSIENKPN